MVVYRSREFLFQNVVAAVSLGLCLVVLVAGLLATDVWSEAPVLGIVLVLLLPLFLLTPMTITVQDDSGAGAMGSDAVLHVSFAGVLRRSIPLADVTKVERREYQPLREFGGWGWRQAWRRPAVAYSTRGSSAVVLTLRDKSQVYLGVNDEPGLVDALRLRIHP